MQRLIKLVNELSPFLDSRGRGYCHAKAEADGVGAVTDLDGEVALALLSYRYYSIHSEVPARSEVRQAVNLVLGALWHERPPRQPQNIMWRATIDAIVESARLKGDFVGTASDALEALQKVTRKQATIFDSLPSSADQLGIVLNRIGLLLRESDVELFRPQRKDLKRLWAWRKLLRDSDTSDTNDATGRQASSDPKPHNHSEMRHDDASDAYTEEEETLMKLYGGVIR